MKKMILLLTICFLMCTIQVFGQVHSRMVVVSHTRGALGTQSTLVLRIDLAAKYAYNIDSYDITFNIGNGLRNLLDAEPTYSHTMFTTPAYTQAASRTDNAITISYDYSSGSYVTTVANETSFSPVATVTITYTETSDVKTTFSWGSYSVFFWHALSPPPFQATGNQVTMPAYLNELTLPVQLTGMEAEYTYEEGAIVNWTTQSEVDVDGFLVHRQDTENGDLMLITPALVQGQGNSSSAFNYQIIDSDVNWNTTYRYYIQEITTGYGPTQVLHGPIMLTTGAAPTRFELYGNYPNPFNPSTNIRFEMMEGGLVELSVYNLLGQKMTTLLNEERNPGIYEIQWNGLNDRGQDAPSGVYLYRISTPEGTQVRKMMKVE
ncbi:T9SS type A sorting domain-containing protein [bacterium]|nr:T9SS type A sorting domain-containing protein [bacterium]